MSCERCSLFLMDHASHELYFKPVGDDERHNEVIRFPASVGIAGWVATHKQLINVLDAYKDVRFNKDVDRRTSLRTRTILCAPVLFDGTLLAVVQMLNKFEVEPCPPELRSKDTSRKGFRETHKVYIPFSAQDEKMLEKCCDEVSKALKGSKRTSQSIDASDNGGSSEEAHYGNKESDPSYNTTKDENITAGSRLNNTASRRNSTRRRGSVGSLMQFVNDASRTSNQPRPKDASPLGEAIAKFRFRD